MVLFYKPKLNNSFALLLGFTVATWVSNWVCINANAVVVSVLLLAACSTHMHSQRTIKVACISDDFSIRLSVHHYQCCCSFNFSFTSSCLFLLACIDLEIRLATNRPCMTLVGYEYDQTYIHTVVHTYVSSIVTVSQHFGAETKFNSLIYHNYYSLKLSTTVKFLSISLSVLIGKTFIPSMVGLVLLT